MGDGLARARERRRGEETASERQEARRQHIAPACLARIAELDQRMEAAARARPVESADTRRFGHRERGVAFEGAQHRSEEHTSELQSLMRISYAVFCLKKKKQTEQKIKTT